VIGGGDWAKDRIIPDTIRAFQENRPVLLRNPQSIRPWQHVLDPLYGYLLLAIKQTEDPESFL
jgi:CDP-glucose 4,6-dehydratase